MENQEDIRVGKVFGKLTVVKQDVDRPSIWRCSCECGGSLEVYGSYLIRSRRRSCCSKQGSKRKDYAGRQFGFLTAVSYLRRSPSGGSVWKFGCVCGSEIELDVTNAVQGNTKSCGCKTTELYRNKRVMPNQQAIKNRAYRTHLRMAAKRGIV